MALFRAQPGAPTRALVDVLVDVGLVLFCAVAMLIDLAYSEKSTFGVLAVGAIIVACLPIGLRHTAPATGFGLAMVAVLGVLSTSSIYNTIAFPAMVCGYALASRHGRNAALVAGAAALPAVLLILQIYSPHPLVGWDTAKNLGLVVLPLALGVASHDRRAYTAALVERAEASERNREAEMKRRLGEDRLSIARDVHDVVAHAMVAINVQAGVGAHLLDRDPEQARATLRDIKKVSGEALNDLRSMLGVLREADPPDSMDLTRPVQGLEGLGELRETLGSAGVALDIDIDPALSQLPATVGATGYRIVQEALTNVIRHAGPTVARVTVRQVDGLVLIEVEDDGGASQPPLRHTGSGNGLRGMRERAIAVGGSLEAGPRPEGGWRVAASLPAGVP